jgi:hypothetical protein
MMTFSSNHWSGFGDTIEFENESAWTAEFDWSLILSGKYLNTESRGTIEFYRDYRPPLLTLSAIGILFY